MNDKTTLVDSGERHEYSSGAIREIMDEKGRCDLLPIDVIAWYLDDQILACINAYIRNGSLDYLWTAIELFCDDNEWTIYEAMREVAVHYAEGAKKYADRNWEKGVPLHSFMDSGIRHYLKWLDKMEDEPHNRAFIWNMLGAIWTHEHHPDLIDLPFNEVNDENNNK